ncbi:peptidylprolyl isomerase [Coraliomargarita sp. SDUM461004]|uniref:peptidylprolyl isomerase n=1 Tax=Thalassobacterium sedimentorum TaxID=3041258 RepID=A0ABU1AIK1_9BACT|nr:peptidylprolyl isomerase [Coraliomargarita sp. SDUM461004]MDQ8193998.1 peptidylprolyl isomerase [Coraliomargarita sp. SDUM461004]
MYSKSYRFVLATLLAATPIFAQDQSEHTSNDHAGHNHADHAGHDHAAHSATTPANEAPVVPVEVSEDELIEIVGYLTAQGGGVASLQLEADEITVLAAGLEKGLTGELDLRAFEQSEVETAFAEAQARAEAIQAAEADKELPKISPAALEKIGAVIVMQSGLQQLGFAAEDADKISRGFIKGASDTTPDPTLEAKMPAFQAFIQTRVQAAQASMEAQQAEMMAAQAAAQEAAKAEFKEIADEWKEKENFNIVLETTQGNVEIELFPSVAPLAVANFVGHIEDGYYNDLIFHRVIDGFMIQGGDPLGQGTGGESIWGKNFPDEFSPEVRFDSEGMLAMANSGPMTNGSQFFITTSNPEWLNDKHTIFGKVVKGYDNVVKIEKVETGDQDKPVVDQKIVKAYVVN